jgi:hypothetical protein
MRIQARMDSSLRWNDTDAPPACQGRQGEQDKVSVKRFHSDCRVVPILFTLTLPSPIKGEGCKERPTLLGDFSQ